MSQESLAGLLAARDRYKKALFAEAIRRLEQDPTLADLPACTSVQEVDNGTCLITEDLKRQLRQQSGRPDRRAGVSRRRHQWPRYPLRPRRRRAAEPDSGGRRHPGGAAPRGCRGTRCPSRHR